MNEERGERNHGGPMLPAWLLVVAAPFVAVKSGISKLKKKLTGKK